MSGKFLFIVPNNNLDEAEIAILQWRLNRNLKDRSHPIIDIIKDSVPKLKLIALQRFEIDPETWVYEGNSSWSAELP